MSETFFDKVHKNDVLHTPDVLSCLANLSNDEVFTPPDVVNKMLDMLPQELFNSPDTKFLDPACKTGVFLREIAKRLIVGIEDQIPDLQQRLDHIFHNQLYGIAITELTSLLSRRSVYCSRYPNGPYSVSKFNTSEGNIRYKNNKHTWENGSCIYCGASKIQWNRAENLEAHAYEFIHRISLKEAFNMEFFDVIISNPPYQLADGGSGPSASPLYDKFVEKAKALNPRYISMIIPSRWFAGGKGLDKFREEMLHDESLRVIVDYPNENECFPGVKIEGGVCYFLWERDQKGPCEIRTIMDKNESVMTRPLLENNMDTFIRYNEAVEIYKKVSSFDEESFMSLVSSRKPFGLDSKFKGDKKGSIKVYCNGAIGYISKNLYGLKNSDLLDKYKVYISYAYGMGSQEQTQVINKPFLGEKNSACSETYLVIAPSDNKEYCENVISYMKTKFFRFLVLLIKNSQHGTSRVYKCVPMQDFSKKWSDKELYKKYNLTKDEINFIESMIKPME